MTTQPWCGYSAPFLGRCSCGDATNHDPGGRYYQEGRLPDSAKQVAVTDPRPEPRDTVTMPLDRVQAIVEHLLTDGTREGLILGDELNVAMGASARRRAARAHDHEEWMLADSAKGGRYCRACGQHVDDPKPEGDLS